MSLPLLIIVVTGPLSKLDSSSILTFKCVVVFRGLLTAEPECQRKGKTITYDINISYLKLNGILNMKTKVFLLIDVYKYLMIFLM